MNQIEVRGVWKQYRVKDRRAVLAVDVARLLTLRGLPYRRFDALRDVSFEVAEGEAFGIIGANGSGKSTLLRVLAGVTVPTRGVVSVQGTVSALLELGAGFHQEMTGRENIWLGAAMMGLSRQQIRSKLDQIIAFAELEEFIDQPVFTYSSGMQIRLGFSIAVALDPDVLILDEVLAVGDHVFRAKSHAAILDFRKRGKTIVLVSHDLHEVVAFCKRSLLLSEGSPVLIDRSSKVVPFYVQTSGVKGGQRYVAVGRLSMAFNNGRVLLFVDGLPITQFYGFYFSLFAARTWFDSTNAAWKVIAESPSGFTAEGRLNGPPLTVTLQAEAQSESEIRISLRAHVHEPFAIDQYHASLLLQPAYQTWSASSQRGEFPPIDVASHDWVHVNPARLTGRSLSVETAGELPALSVVADADVYAPTVLNTDHAGNARVLQFLVRDATRWEPGERVLFEGTISIAS